MVPLNPKYYGKFHEYFLPDIILSVGQNKTWIIGVEISEYSQVNHGYDRHLVEYRKLGLHMISPHFFMSPWARTQTGFVIDETAI